MSKRKPAPALPVAALVGCLSALLAACGSGAGPASVAHIGSTTTSTPVASAAGSQGSQLQEFVSCMRHHGVPNFPELVMTPNGGAVPVRPVNIDTGSPAVPRARTGLRALSSAGSSAASSAAPITPKDQLAYIRAAACMRSHGVPEFPDPKFSETSVTFPKPPEMNASIAKSPTFLRAREICEQLIPAGLPYS